MKRFIFPIIINFCMFSCGSEQQKEEIHSPVVLNDSLQQVDSISVLLALADTSLGDSNSNEVDRILGDIDNDGVEEMFIIYNLVEFDSSEIIQDSPRVLVVYKFIDSSWQEFYRSENAILNSDGGGMMGDPYQYLKINNGKMIIAHFGGSSWKWFEQHTYKWNGIDFIQTFDAGYYGKPCEYWDSTSYDFETGRAYLSSVYESCPDDEIIFDSVNIEEFIKKGIRIELKSKGNEDIRFQSPKYKKMFYLASKS